MEELPRPFQRFIEKYPEVHTLHASLAEAVAHSGPLDDRTRRLVHLGIAIGQQSQGAVKSHARRALREGISAEELRHAALQALSTAGFPCMIAAMEWIEEAIAER